MKGPNMKKIIVVIIVAIFLFTPQLPANDENNPAPEVIAYEGNKKLIFEPSPDERVVGHIIYFNAENEEEEYTKRLDGREVNEWIIEEGLLYPSTTYIFTATAYDAQENQSVRSEPYLVQIAPRDIPELPDTNLPEIIAPLQPPATVTINITITQNQ
jgi:hypothetical protein